MRAGSPLRMSALEFTPPDDTYGSRGGAHNFSTTDAFLHDVQLLADLRFNYKRVILGFLYLSSHPIIEKAKFMFGLLS